jgi:hypothetical protein
MSSVCPTSRKVLGALGSTASAQPIGRTAPEYGAADGRGVSSICHLCTSRGVSQRARPTHRRGLLRSRIRLDGADVQRHLAVRKPSRGCSAKRSTLRPRQLSVDASSLPSLGWRSGQSLVHCYPSPASQSSPHSTPTTGSLSEARVPVHGPPEGGTSFLVPDEMRACAQGPAPAPAAWRTVITI